MRLVMIRTTSSSSTTEPRGALLVFTRTPVPGRVKTRLLPLVSPEQAVAIHIRLLRRTLNVARHVAAERLELWCAPSQQHPVLVRIEEEFSLRLRLQRGADLGARMNFALQQTLQTCSPVTLIGSDCVDLRASDIRLSMQQLAQGYDVTLGPALDGGYYLIGLKQDCPQLFSDIQWGSATVLRETRARIRELGLDAYELPARRDIDRPADLCHL